MIRSSAQERRRKSMPTLENFLYAHFSVLTQSLVHALAHRSKSLALSDLGYQSFALVCMSVDQRLCQHWKMSKEKIWHANNGMAVTLKDTLPIIPQDGIDLRIWLSLWSYCWGKLWGLYSRSSRFANEICHWNNWIIMVISKVPSKGWILKEKVISP